MAVSDFWTRVAKLRATIIEVDTANNVVDVRAGDGGTRRIMVWEVSSGFRWPIVGEDWSIYEQNGSWYLGDRINDVMDDHAISNMQPGDQRLDGTRIFDTAGDRIYPVVGGLVTDDHIIYDSTTDKFKPEPTFSITSRQVRDVGEVGQIRAGRELTLADFTAMGLGAPLGIWNLGTLNDVSGNAYHLSNKGSVQFVPGITGAATEAARFDGSTAQGLYVSAASNGTAEQALRLPTLSLAGWIKGAKKATQQTLVTKLGASGQYSYELFIQPNNVAAIQYSANGTALFTVNGTSDVTDNRWHHVGLAYDGYVMRLYVDGMPQTVQQTPDPIFPGGGPFNIGARQADAVTTGVLPYFGVIDEVFVTADILTGDQMYNLYCARIPHTFGRVPSGARVNVRRQQRGVALALANFSILPSRVHNLNNTLADLANGVTLTANPGTGSITDTPGPTGLRLDAKTFKGAHAGLSATDAGLPSGTAARTMGTWFRTVNQAAGSVGLVSYGTVGGGEASVFSSTSGVYFQDTTTNTPLNGPNPSDGFWHHVVAVLDNAAPDGLRIKVYYDGRVVGVQTTLGSAVLAGANKFRIGARADGTLPFIGQIARAFVYPAVMSGEEVRALYNLGSQPLATSPKTAEDHVVAMGTTSVLVTFDTLEGCDLVDLRMIR